MLACLFVSACLLAPAAAVSNTSTAPSPPPAAAASLSSSLATSTCLGYECRPRHTSDTTAVIGSNDASGIRTSREPKKLGTSRDVNTSPSAGTTKLTRAAGLDLHHHRKGDPNEDGDDPVYDKQVLHEGAARMTEDLRKEDNEEENDDDDVVLPAEQEHIEEGRAKTRQTKLGKKVDGSVLNMLMMLKMMPLMFVSTKVAVLGFLVQLKSLMLSLVSVSIAVVQFFWRFQEKRQRANAASTLQTTAATHGWQEPAMWPDRRKYVSF